MYFFLKDMMTDAKKTSEPRSKSRKTILSDESDSETSDKPKENQKSEDSAEVDEEKLVESPAKSKNVRKRKKKFKIIDDSSNSSVSNSEAPATAKPITVLSEIANSENAQNIKLNKAAGNEAVFTRTNTAESLLAAVNSEEDSDEDDEDDDEDDDMPLSMKIQQPKRQRLILSDGDDD